jgi:hypothetical protein
MQPAGQDPETLAPRVRNGHSTALFTHECQSFLDNVIAGFWGRSEHAMTPAVACFKQSEHLICRAIRLRRQNLCE